MVVHLEDGRVVEMLSPATGERLPAKPKPHITLSVGMSPAECESVLLTLPGFQKYYFPALESAEPGRILIGDPRDATTTVVLVVSRGLLKKAYWFGTGESLLSANDR